jgi:hypothetical protein
MAGNCFFTDTVFCFLSGKLSLGDILGMSFDFDDSIFIFA